MDGGMLIREKESMQEKGVPGEGSRIQFFFYYKSFGGTLLDPCSNSDPTRMPVLSGLL